MLNQSNNGIVFKKIYIFAPEKTNLDMAKPIEATPVIEGEDAFAFFVEMEKGEKASKEEKKRIEEGAKFIESLLTFAF